MREILFRGKNIKGIWHIGLLAHIGNAWYISNKAGVATAFEVIPETVGQYTGLTDKNGKMIFEGDVVLQPVRETRKHSPCVIEFRKGAFMAHYKSENRFFDRYYDINSYTKVIGNIHDNGELLKGE